MRWAISDLLIIILSHHSLIISSCVSEADAAGAPAAEAEASSSQEQGKEGAS